MGGLLKIIAALSALPVAGLVAAFVMMRLGLRGRRGDDHPICRGCGYDLFGMFDLRDRCPGCGRDVREASAIQIGHRERRRGVLRLATAVGLVSLLGLAVVGRTVARGLEDVGVRPTWWLMNQLDGPPGVQQQEAFGELARRFDR